MFINLKHDGVTKWVNRTTIKRFSINNLLEPFYIDVLIRLIFFELYILNLLISSLTTTSSSSGVSSSGVSSSGISSGSSGDWYF